MAEYVWPPRGGGELSDNSVTLAKLQQIAQNQIFSRYTSGTGNVELVNLGANTVFNSSTLNFARYVKTPVRLATAAALTVTSSGSGVGQTLTATSNGALSVDGVAAVVGNRILVKDQATTSQNGIYVVTDAGSAGTPFILTRATDFDGSAGGDVQFGDMVLVLTGGATSINVGVFYYVSTTGTITVGSTTINFNANGSVSLTIAGAASRLAFFGDFDSITSNSSLTFSATNISLGVGASTSATARLNIAYTTSDSATSYNGALNSSAHTLTADNANGVRGWTSSITLAHSTFNATAGITTPALEGFRSTVSVSSGSSPGVVTAIAAYNALARNQGGGTLTNNIGYEWQASSNSGGGVITNNYGFYAAAQTVGTFSAAFYSLSAAATGRYNLYMSGTAVNYFAGNTVIGADANNAANTFAKLAVYGTTQANCRIGWGFSGTYGQTYAAAEFSSVSQNGNTWTLFVNQIGGTGTQVLQFIGNGQSTFLNSIYISTAAATISSGTSGNFIAGNNTSTTVPSYIYAQGDTNTGFGRGGADVANVIAGGVEIQRWNSSASGFSVVNTRGRVHIAHTVAGGTHASTLVINNLNAGTGGVGTGPYVGIDFSHMTDSASDIQRKSAFGFEKTTSNSRGDFIWSLNNAADNTNVSYLTDERMRLTMDGRLGIGTGGTVSAKLHVIDTTETSRFGFDSSNYFTTAVSSSGAATFNATGSSASFTFSDPVIAGNVVRLKGYTVATLPTGVQGDKAFVTDLLGPVYLTTAVGGGAVVGPVFYDGTNWVCG